MKTDNYCAPRFLSFTSMHVESQFSFGLFHSLSFVICFPSRRVEEKLFPDNESIRMAGRSKNVPEEGRNVSIVSLMGLSHA